MSTVTMIICDIKECGVAAYHVQKTVSIAFTTEQTEGRTVPKYLEGKKLDFCEEHFKQYIDSLPLTATGSQGHNEYSIKEIV